MQVHPSQEETLTHALAGLVNPNGQGNLDRRRDLRDDRSEHSKIRNGSTKVSTEGKRDACGQECIGTQSGPRNTAVAEACSILR